jgi:hypothetical protein
VIATSLSPANFDELALVLTRNSLQNYLSFYFNLYGFRGDGLHTYILEDFAMSSRNEEFHKVLASVLSAERLVSNLPMTKGGSFLG